MTAPRGRAGAPRNGVPPGARGAVLVGLAVIVGVVGLQILDDSGSTDVATQGTDSTTGTTTGGTETSLAAARDPSQVRVKVYNASGVQGQAQATSDMLRGSGWVTQEPATYGSQRVGTVVQCVSGFESEANVLATTVGRGATVEPYPSSPPAGASEADCLVIEGKAA